MIRLHRSLSALFCGGTLFRNVLFALLTAAVLLPSVEVRAQDDEEQTQAEKEAAKAEAEAAAQARESAQVFAQLVQQSQEMRAREAELLQQKEAEAQQELEEQQALAQEQIARRDRAEARGNELNRQYEANVQQIAEITQLLNQHEGNLGELFGVTRQVAGDATGVLQESLLTTQYEPPPGEEPRAEFMRRIAGATALPSIIELERLWFELLREMAGSGEVVRYETGVIQLETGESVPTEVVRVGPFTVSNENEFLGYISSEKSLTELEGQLAGNFRDIAANLANTSPDAGYTKAVVDPASGALLGLYLTRPNWIQRVALGEVVGYVIIAVGIIGVLLALFQYGYLLKTRMAVSTQVKNLSHPTDDNPLGRLMLAFGVGGGEGEGANRPPENPELAELRLSEAVLREVPRLERFQSFLRLAVAAGPLLGLVGTVVGMIITFHAIVASGSSDPKLMAHGIGQAMIATVLGLGIAIPLLFLNAGLTAFSGSITQILDEQSEILLADNIISTKRRHGAV